MRWTQAKSAEKKEAIKRLLQYGTVMVFIDSRREDVLVPEQHKGNPQLLLNLDYAFQIPDFEILDDRVQVSLSFGGKNFFCVLPYASIYVLRSQSSSEIVMFPEDIPKDLTVETQESPEAKQAEEKKRKKASFKVLQNEGDEDESHQNENIPQLTGEQTVNAEVPAESATPVKKQKAHLRLVKSD